MIGKVDGLNGNSYEFLYLSQMGLFSTKPKQVEPTFETFQQARNLEERKARSARSLLMHPDCVPVIIEPSERCAYKKKYIRITVKKETLIRNLLHDIRTASQDTLRGLDYYFLAEDSVLKPEHRIGDLYESYAAEDGFLYLTYNYRPGFVSW